MAKKNKITNIGREFIEATRDIKLLWASVFLRLLSYGLTNQVLTLFLNKINLDESKIGLFMSLTLVGDVFCSYVLTWYADVWGRRRILIYGSIMMCLSGIVFATSENFHILLLFAIIGVISPSSDEVGPFKSIEESMIAHLSPNNKRPEIYAIHSLVGTIGSALGAIVSGSFISLLKHYKLANTDLQCYKLTFLLYAFFALCKVIIMVSLSEKTELDSHYYNEEQLPESIVTDELAPLLEQRRKSIDIQQESARISDSLNEVSVTQGDYNQDSNNQDQINSDKLSPETVAILMRLLCIFMIDSLGSGFMTSGWMVYYYKKWFHMGSFALGSLFFMTQIVMSISTIPSSILPRIFGPVKATLLVQIPSGIFSILIPFAANHLSVSILLLNCFFGTAAMDVTSRQILLTNLIRPTDLTKVMGIVNIGKTFARCIGPIFTGILANRNYLWFCYIISGVLVIVADCILACSFLHVDMTILAQINGE